MKTIYKILSLLAVALSVAACNFVAPKKFSAVSNINSSEALSDSQISTFSENSSIVEKYYSITILKSENGSVISNVEKAKEGNEVTLTITPDEGYDLDTLLVNNSNVASQVVNNTFSLIMSNKDLTIKATFKVHQHYDMSSWVPFNEFWHCHPQICDCDNPPGNEFYDHRWGNRYNEIPATYLSEGSYKTKCNLCDYERTLTTRKLDPYSFDSAELVNNDDGDVLLKLNFTALYYSGNSMRVVVGLSDKYNTDVFYYGSKEPTESDFIDVPVDSDDKFFVQINLSKIDLQCSSQYSTYTGTYAILFGTDYYTYRHTYPANGYYNRAPMIDSGQRRYCLCAPYYGEFCLCVDVTEIYPFANEETRFFQTNDLDYNGKKKTWVKIGGRKKNDIALDDLNAMETSIDINGSFIEENNFEYYYEVIGDKAYINIEVGYYCGAFNINLCIGGRYFGQRIDGRTNVPDEEFNFENDDRVFSISYNSDCITYFIGWNKLEKGFEIEIRCLNCQAIVDVGPKNDDGTNIDSSEKIYSRSKTEPYDYDHGNGLGEINIEVIPDEGFDYAYISSDGSGISYGYYEKEPNGNYLFRITNIYSDLRLTIQASKNS